jgi:hypothetical protein
MIYPEMLSAITRRDEVHVRYFRGFVMSFLPRQFAEAHYCLTIHALSDAWEFIRRPVIAMHWRLRELAGLDQAEVWHGPLISHRHADRRGRVLLVGLRAKRLAYRARSSSSALPGDSQRFRRERNLLCAVLLYSRC